MKESTAPPQPEKSQATLRLLIWLTFLAFLLIVVVFHSSISEIRFGNEGVSAKMSVAQDVAKLTPEDRKAGETDLAERVKQLESEARTHAEPAKPTRTDAPQSDTYTAPVTEATYQQPAQAQPPVQAQQPAQAQQPSLPNIAGNWSSPLGLVYQVNQYGNYVLISEVNQGIVEAAAGGQIDGWSFTLPSQNLANHAGVLTLTVSPDQRHMNGQYRDNVTGQMGAIVLSR